MAIATTSLRNTLASAYATAATHAALYSTAPSGGAAGTELSGGSPAYARKAISWSAPTNGVITATVVFDVPSGATVAGTGVHSAITAGNFLDGTSLTSQAFASQGTYTVNLTYTQT